MWHTYSFLICSEVSIKSSLLAGVFVIVVGMTIRAAYPLNNVEISRVAVVLQDGVAAPSLNRIASITQHTISTIV